MKNLKKILIALAVLAVLVSSVAVMVVTANDEPQYTGSLDEAIARLGTVKDGDSIVARQSAIKTVYDYLEQNPIDPATEGYDEFWASFNQKSLIIANDYYLLVAGKANGTEKSDSLDRVYTYLADFPIDENTADPDGEETKYVSYAELIALVDADNFNIAKELYGEALLAFKGDAEADPVVEADRTLAINTLAALYVHVERNPIAPETEGYADFRKAYNTLSVEISEQMISELMAARDEMSKATDEAAAEAKTAYRALIEKNIPALADHLVTAPVDGEAYTDLAERLQAVKDDIVLVEFDRIVFLYDDYEGIPDEATDACPNPATTKETYLARVNQALTSSTVPDTVEGYTELVEKIQAEKVILAAEKEQRKNALSEQTDLSEYELTDGIKENKFTKDTDAWGSPNKSAEAYGEIVKPAGAGTSGYDGYMRYVYGSTVTHVYGTMSISDNTEGFVINVDMMFEGRNGKNFTEASFSYRNYGSYANGKGGNYSGSFSNLFKFNTDKATGNVMLSSLSGSNAPVIYNVAAQGEWINVTITMDPTTRYGSLYVNYEYMFDIYFGPATTETIKGEIRCNTNYSWQYVSYDNYYFYKGTGYRILDKFSGMSDNDKFDYYVNYATDATKPPMGRNSAYGYAKSMLDGIKAQYEGIDEANMSDEQKHLKSLVLALEGFDYTNEVLIPAKALNLEKLKGLAEKVPTEVTSTSISTVNAAIKAVEAFVSEKGEYLDKANAEYLSIMQMINETKAGITKCENAVKFAKALTQFERATTLASMKKRALAADEVYALARYDRADNVAFVEADPAIRAFEVILNGKDAKPEDEGYVTAFEYYASFPDIIAAQARLENSYRILDCIDIILSMEGYEDTEQFWSANSEELDFYITIIRNIASVDNYDATVAGIDAAIEKYEVIDTFFYNVLQEQHIQTIKAQLDKFALTDSYIEKVGICTYVERYFAENDINLALPEIQELQYRHAIYESELETQIEDYKDLLEQNTRYFIDAINRMDSVRNYSQLKPLYDEALSYYYGMNVDSDEAKVAIASFNAYEQELALIENDSKLFEEKVRIIGFAQSSDEIYSALMECAKYYENTDATYSAKIASSIEKFEKAMNEYNAGVDSINNEINSTINIVSAVRSASVPAAVLAIVSNFYKN